MVQVTGKAAMDHERFIGWLEQIYATAEAEIDCQRLQALLPTYVDLEIAGNHPADRLPEIKVHLAQCPDCAEEYQALRAVAGLDAQNRVPEVEESLARFPAVTTPERASETHVTAL